jgi:hypothetical protein
MAAAAPPPVEPARPAPATVPAQAGVPAPDANQPTTGELSLVPVPDLPEADEPVEEEVGGWAPFAEPAGAEAPSVMAALAVALPGVDPVTTLLEMAPLMFLYESSIWLAVLFERRWQRLPDAVPSGG